jgi:hypothetical protein
MFTLEKAGKSRRVWERGLLSHDHKRLSSALTIVHDPYPYCIMCPLGRMREGMVGRIGGIRFRGVWAYKKSED